MASVEPRYVKVNRTMSLDALSQRVLAMVREGRTVVLTSDRRQAKKARRIAVSVRSAMPDSAHHYWIDDGHHLVVLGPSANAIDVPITYHRWRTPGEEYQLVLDDDGEPVAAEPL